MRKVTESNQKYIEWLKKYNLAKIYYEHYGNLEIPESFKTNNGYLYDNEGIALGNWISNQRQAYKEQGTGKITNKEINLLNEIGMLWEDINFQKWMIRYFLAQAYYVDNGNSKIRRGYTTADGINLGNWVSNQRSIYKGNLAGVLTQNQIKLLNEINMEWFSPKIDKKLQQELITSKNVNRKNIEILNRFRDYLTELDNSKSYSKDDINAGFTYKLNRCK